VIHACRELQGRGLRPAVLSRGYRSPGAQGNDEARLLRSALPGVPVVENPDRRAAALALLDAADCFVLDDGFQHLPLHRDADVVLVDATDPFGGGRCPPAGRLREPLAALERATLVILTRADLVSRESLGATMRAVRERTPAPVATASFPADCGEPVAGRDLLLACAIGNPRAFRRTVESMGGIVREERIFRDHHAYDARDAAELARSGLPVAVTEKDAVKLRPLWGASMPPLLVVRIEFRALTGAREIAAAFDAMRPA